MEVCTEMECSFDGLFIRVSGFFQGVFEKLGRFIGRHPKVLIGLCLILTLCLSIGIIILDKETDIEVLYTPVNNRAAKDRTRYQAQFPDTSGSYYLQYAATSREPYAEVNFGAKDDNIFSKTSMGEIRRHITHIKDVEGTFRGKINKYSDVCALRDGNCVVSGEMLTTDDALEALEEGSLTFPIWRNYNISRELAVVTTREGKVVRAKYLKVVFHLRKDFPSFEAKSLAWEESVLQLMPNLIKSSTEIWYTTSESVDKEIDSNTSGDIIFFTFTIAIMVVYASRVVGGNMVSSRSWAALAGVLAAVFGAASSLGLVSLCGVKFVNIVCVMPFLIIGIGVDDMFLLMSSWADAYSDKDYSVVYRMGQTFRSAGIGITITSLTDLLAFVIGATSVFVSVRNFCIYMGVAIIFCYIYQCLFFGSCLALHGHRVDQNRHCITCRVTKSRDQLRNEGKSICKLIFCGGSKPTKRGQDERIIEKLPRIYLPKLLLNPYGKCFAGILFIIYIAVSSWGVLNFKEGLTFKILTSRESYYHKFSDMNDEYFDIYFSITFVFGSKNSYIDSDTTTQIENLFEQSKAEKNIEKDSLICWLNSYRVSPFYNDTSESNLIKGLKFFLTASPQFRNDVIFDTNNSSIVNSRCFITTVNTVDSNVQADVMTRMRNLVDRSPLDVYVFHPAFVLFEQYLSILPSTLESLGIALVVMTVMTFVFLPNPLLVLLVVLNIVSILVGVFGSLHFWDLTLSSVTMIQLIMSVGFSVDFSVHVCSAYILTEGSTRREITKSAITHAASPILNGALSSLFGIFVLIFSNSFIFNAFFKVMFTVLLVGTIHAVIFLPVMLSLVGPLTQIKHSKHNSKDKESSGTSISKRHDFKNAFPETLEHISDRKYRESHVSPEHGPKPTWFSSIRSKGLDKGRERNTSQFKVLPTDNTSSSHLGRTRSLKIGKDIYTIYTG